MVDKLPRPEVSVNTTPDGITEVVISRDGKSQVYKGEGWNEQVRTREVVKQIINDGKTAEWLP